MQMAKVRLPRIIPAVYAPRYQSEGSIEVLGFLYSGPDGSVWRLAKVLQECTMLVRFSTVDTAVVFHAGDLVRFQGMDFAPKGDSNRGNHA